jgi:hypothetical protein
MIIWNVCQKTASFLRTLKQKNAKKIDFTIRINPKLTVLAKLFNFAHAALLPKP